MSGRFRYGFLHLIGWHPGRYEMREMRFLKPADASQAHATTFHGHDTVRLVVRIMAPRGEVRRILRMRTANDRETSLCTHHSTNPDDAPELAAAFFQAADP